MSAQASISRKKVKFIDPAEFTPKFAWKKSAAEREVEHVFCEGVDLVEAAAKFGTPTYLYSRAAITDAYEELDRGLGKTPHTICFAMKSNGNLSILQHLAKMGSGFDIVSGGELEHLGHLGVRGDRIVFSGVGKTRYEIRDALQYSPNGRGHRKSRDSSGILLFNVESEAELEVLLEESERQIKPRWKGSIGCDSCEPGCRGRRPSAHCNRKPHSQIWSRLAGSAAALSCA